jgi:hypothetical protein
MILAPACDVDVLMSVVRAAYAAGDGEGASSTSDLWTFVGPSLPAEVGWRKASVSDTM